MCRCKSKGAPWHLLPEKGDPYYADIHEALVAHEFATSIQQELDAELVGVLKEAAHRHWAVEEQRIIDRVAQAISDEIDRDILNDLMKLGTK